MTSHQDYLYIPHSKPSLSKIDFEVLNDVIATGMIAEGQLVKDFEEAMSNYLGLYGGVATSSGTDALFLALKALNVGSGDEVIIPTYVCRSVWDAVKQTGAIPVLCDIGEDWCINYELIEPLVTKQTKAIIPVHIFGISADIGPICELGIPVIEDCCQALGSQRNNQLVGTFGDLCVLSFQATKLLTTGEGGMVLSKDDALIKEINALKHGERNRLNVRYRKPMSDLQAALGLSQLSQYNYFLNKRRDIAENYFNQLSSIDDILPHSIRHKSIFFRFPLTIEQNIEYIISLFDKDGVQVRKGVDRLLHRELKLQPHRYNGAEKAFKKTLCLPIYPSLNFDEVNHIINMIKIIYFGSRD